MKYRSALNLAITASILFTSNNLAAADDNDIIVTATRTAQTANDSLSSVTVITKEQIEQRQANDIPELLNGIQGIDISNSGGLGKATSIYMRGTNASHVLILIDGIRMGSATLGTVSLQSIPVSQIERIEIVRGPRASLYGSDAIGGVIQIFTKKAQSNNMNLSIGYGSNNTERFNAGFNTRKENSQLSLNIGYLQTNGFNALKTSDPDKDGYKNASVSANYKYQLSEQSYLTATFMQAEGNNQYDDRFTPSNIVDADFVQQATGINYVFSAIKDWQVSLKLSQSKDESSNFKNGAANGTFNTTRDMLSWQNDISLSDTLLLTTGIDYQNDKVDSTTNYDKKTRDNKGYFIQQQWFGDNNDILTAIRVDDNEAFGNNTTGNISWGINLNSELRLISSYGTGFKAPTFNNLYFPSSGNANIKPEESESYEIELRGNATKMHWAVNLYRTDISNLIVYPAPTYQVTNLDKANIDGLEVNITLKQKDYNTRVELAFINPVNSVTKKVLPRRAKHTMRVNVDQNTGNWRSGLEIIIKGKRYDNTSNSTKLDGYSLINLNTRYPLSKNWMLRGKIHNLLGSKYQTANNYNSEGLGVYVSLNYSGD
ncbi:Outer membrane vitamin B12 receptor BtuB [hydrothermal vent metagenome]|uniref:Outer membrane vitamin B12 receptor BtuB n=1 Tax=hydrothermal vent metagenome TaxID=652676 RepID=A0A3B0ZI52_9ZZZZ